MSGLEILMAGSTLLSAGSELAAGKAESQQLKFAAREEERAAEEARRAAAIDAGLAVEDAERTIGTARAIAGASGFDVSGSARDVLSDLGAQKRYNANALIYGGDMERRTRLRQAAMYRAGAKNAKTQSWMRAGATVLSGGYRMTQLDKG